MKICLINVLEGVVEGTNMAILKYQLEIAQKIAKPDTSKEVQGISSEHSKINAEEIDLNDTQIKNIYVSLTAF